MNKILSIFVILVIFVSSTVCSFGRSHIVSDYESCSDQIYDIDTNTVYGCIHNPMISSSVSAEEANNFYYTLTIGDQTTNGYWQENYSYNMKIGIITFPYAGGSWEFGNVGFISGPYYEDAVNIIWDLYDDHIGRFYGSKINLSYVGNEENIKITELPKIVFTVTTKGNTNIDNKPYSWSVVENVEDVLNTIKIKGSNKTKNITFSPKDFAAEMNTKLVVDNNNTETIKIENTDYSINITKNCKSVKTIYIAGHNKENVTNFPGLIVIGTKSFKKLQLKDKKMMDGFGIHVAKKLNTKKNFKASKIKRIRVKQINKTIKKRKNMYDYGFSPCGWV